MMPDSPTNTVVQAVGSDSPALFEVLNAKRMTDAEIAHTFVVPAQYKELVSPDHSFLVGPRGSGKTTLLRMLQGSALMEWSGVEAEEYRRRIRYSTIFVPADRLWSSQTILQGGELAERLASAAFTTQLCIALVESLQYRINYFGRHDEIHLPAELGAPGERELVEACAEAWRLQVRTPSLNGLLSALDVRIEKVAELAALPPAAEALEPWVDLAAMECLRFGVRLFNRMTGQPEHRWALLLDEMELAPRAIHNSLMQSIRGGDPALVLKLSFSPFDQYIAPETPEANAPAVNNDFKAIYLWYAHQTESRSFARSLWAKLAKDVANSDRPARAILGPSQIDSSGANWRFEDYASDSAKMRLIREMDNQDAEFHKFLSNHKVDLERPEDLSYQGKSATLRKAYPLLVYRNALATFSKGKARPRHGNSKPSDVYSGDAAVFTALEGNPRWMKAVFTQLLSRYDGERMLSKGVQYDTLRDAAARFEALLSLLPAGEEPDIAVLDVVNMIARHLRYRALGAFSADPATTFRVDKSVPPGVLDAIKAGLTAGAIVHVRDDKSPPILSSLVGERFRLAYLLCVRREFEVPMRLGKELALSAILRAESARLDRRQLPQAPTLF